jgi:hypothetical protein
MEIMFVNSNEARSPLTGGETARNQTIAGAIALLVAKILGDVGYSSYTPEISVIVMAVVSTIGNLFRNLKSNSVFGRWIG